MRQMVAQQPALAWAVSCMTLSDQLEPLKAKLLTGAAGRVGIYGVHGMGGIGKSVLAAALAHETDVLQADDRHVRR